MRRAARVLLLLPWLGLAACDDDAADFPALTCDDTACDPACASLLGHPPDPMRSSCSPPGPLCDYSLMGRAWSYTCGDDGHIHCSGTCPSADLGAAPPDASVHD